MKTKASLGKPSAKKAHAVIGSFGSASVLWGKGLGVRVEMFADDIARIVEAAGEHFTAAGDEAAAKAAETLRKKLCKQTTKLRISLEVVIAAHGAKLEPIIKTTGAKTTWETPSGHCVSAPRGYGMVWETERTSL